MSRAFTADEARAVRYRLVAMGASAGGPTAVTEVIASLSAAFPLPILLVLHIGRSFGAGFVGWLEGQTGMPATFARSGEPLPPPGQPRVIMAPPERHLVVRDGRLWLTTTPERFYCRPSVDTLFESVAAEVGSAAIGCLLTGMGRDGALGLLAMKRAGAATVAQDEATSVVFGMPKEAIRLGAVEHVLPLSGIGPRLDLLARQGRGGRAPVDPGRRE